MQETKLDSQLVEIWMSSWLVYFLYPMLGKSRSLVNGKVPKVPAPATRCSSVSTGICCSLRLAVRGTVEMPALPSQEDAQVGKNVRVT